MPRSHALIHWMILALYKWFAYLLNFLTYLLVYFFKNIPVPFPGRICVICCCICYTFLWVIGTRWSYGWEFYGGIFDFDFLPPARCDWHCPTCAKRARDVDLRVTGAGSRTCIPPLPGRTHSVSADVQIRHWHRQFRLVQEISNSRIHGIVDSLFCYSSCLSLSE